MKYIAMLSSASHHYKITKECDAEQYLIDYLIREISVNPTNFLICDKDEYVLASAIESFKIIEVR